MWLVSVTEERQASLDELNPANGKVVNMQNKTNMVRKLLTEEHTKIGKCYSGDWGKSVINHPLKEDGRPR